MTLLLRYALAVALLAACCVPATMPGAEARARSALDVLAAVIDPAYQLAMQACRDRLDLTMREGERDAGTLHEVEAQLVAINARCDQTQAVFERIRSAHDEAITAVEEGRFDVATERLDRVREAWRSLQTGGL